MPESSDVAADRVVAVTGASSGFGAMSVRAIGSSGCTVYAGMRGTTGHNAAAVAQLKSDAGDTDSDLRAVELDISQQDSVDRAITRIIAECGRLDVIVHNAGHMVFGPAEAFTPQQIADVCYVKSWARSA